MDHNEQSVRGENEKRFLYFSLSLSLLRARFYFSLLFIFSHSLSFSLALYRLLSLGELFLLVADSCIFSPGFSLSF